MLRFPEFTGEWEEKKLGEIFNISAGGDIDSKHVSQEKTKIFNYPIYANSEKEKGLYGYSDIYKIEENVVTVTGRGVNIGIAHARNHKFYPIVRLLVLKPKQDDNVYFYEYQINRLNLYKESTGVPQLTAPQVSGYMVNYPPITEQTKIASFLTAVDEKLTQLKKKKTLLEQYKKGIMQKLFSQELRFKDNNNQDFPDWQEKTLGELSFKVDKKNKKNIQYPIYSINNINGFIPQSDQFDGMDSNKRGYDISLYKIIERNTFAYNPARINVGSLGYSGDLHNIIISSLYVCFKTVEEVYDNFLLQYFSTNAFNKAVLTNVEGGVREYLFFENFSRINLSLPSFPEQQKIATFLSSIDEKISHSSAQIEKMEAWKKGLLQQMFC